MAAITFDKTGVELTALRLEGFTPQPPSERGARQRVARWTYTAPGAVTSGSQIEFLEFPVNITIIGGAVTASTLSNSGQMSIGWTVKSVPVDTNKADFKAAATTVGAFLASTWMKTTATTTVFGTLSVGDMAANDVLHGYVTYVDES